MFEAGTTLCYDWLSLNNFVARCFRDYMTVNQKLYHIDYYNNRSLKAVRPDLNDLIQEKIHGIVVSDFLSTHEVGLILQGFQEPQRSGVGAHSKDFDSYPISVFLRSLSRCWMPENGEANYLAMSSDFISGFLQRFGVDVLKKLNRVFGSFQNAPALHHAPWPASPCALHISWVVCRRKGV